MRSNWLSVTKIVMLAYKTIEYLLKTSSANLFKLDRKQVADRTMNRSFIDYYPGWFLSPISLTKIMPPYAKIIMQPMLR